MRGWWQELAGLVLPVACAGCESPRTALCGACRQVLYGAGPRRVRPRPEPAGLPAVYAAAGYGGPVRELLLSHKERGALSLAAPLGGALAGAVTAAVPPAVAAARWPGPGGLVLVPVPSVRRAVRARGHDPARRIALAAAARLRRDGVPARVACVLRHRRAVADQAGLGARERLANLAGALEVRPGGAGLVAGRAVVLVDDLMTTGASLVEAARAVSAMSRTAPYGGFPALSAAVVAACSEAFENNWN
ncbi:ComF family protein [Streptomyces bambusae]|uniref:ComF family protein n=1 Tax=Streptomyces bambusae TaxID=1550616 RepID=UPI001CFFF871|nr:ComF family protein [Streptomyces bambusae]MCB5169429.1 ComF family protein [Streptomyces bambusae]